MSTMRIRRSECRATKSDTSNGSRMRELNACRRSSFEKPTKYASNRLLMPYQMNPHRT